ncbi:MAG: S-layer domain-containing protein [Thermoanaerobacterales bacterium 50_218]|nr:MAG: S-layer domain-containing protein [Thermoanaerobacterales bacterium 50_218]HAA89516.1 hypothetical protein [Peptococcaceae bacterium]
MRKAVFLLVLLLVLATGSTAWGVVSEREEVSDSILTRGKFAVMLVQAANMGAIQDEEAAARLLVEKGILRGYPDGDLKLDRGITRLEATVLVGRTLGLKDGIEIPEWMGAPKNELPQGHWGYDLYDWISRLGLVEGDAYDVLTEAQGAEFLSKVFTSDARAKDVLNKVKEKERELRENSGVRTGVECSMKMIARPGVEGAEKIPQVEGKAYTVQEMVWPDRIHQTTTVSMNIPGEEQQEITSEMYFVDGKMYQQMPDPDTGELTWYRYPEDMLPNIGVTELIIKQAAEQTQAVPPELEEFIHYQMLGTKEIDGEEVYEIAFYGRVDDFERFVKAAMSRFGSGEQLQQFVNQAAQIAGQMLDSMSYWGIQYVDVDEYVTRGMQSAFLITYAEEFAGMSMPIEAMEMTMEMEEYEFSDEIKIEVPEEALNAPLLPFLEGVEEQPSTEEVQEAQKGEW